MSSTKTIRFEAPNSLLQGIKWFVEHKRDEAKQRTSERTKSIGNVLSKELKLLNLQELPIEKVNAGFLSQFISTTKYNRKVGNNRSRDYHNFLYSCFEWFYANEWINRNPMISVPKDRRVAPENHKPYTDEQLREIGNYIEDRNPFLWRFILFMVHTGLRPNEVRQLKVNAIDTENWIVRVKASITKQGVARNINVPVHYIPTLRKWRLEKYPQNFYLFSNLSKGIGRKLSGKNSFSAAFKIIKDELDIDPNHTLYGFRHTFALIILEKNNFNPEAVQQYLGHGNKESSFKYLMRPDARVLRDKNRKKFAFPIVYNL